MIKAAIEYLTKLGRPVTVEVEGRNYSTIGLEEIKESRPNSLSVSTLTSLVEYIKSKIDSEALEGKKLLVQVKSPLEVSLLSNIKRDKSREEYLRAIADVPNINFNRFMDTEGFNIMLQSNFVPNEDKDIVLKVVGNIKDEKVNHYGDDGISQTVTAKTGVATVSNVIVPNPVLLAPYRTFTEIEQVESNFVFRMKDGPSAALFEADGGAWRNEATRRIKEYLDRELDGLGVTVIA